MYDVTHTMYEHSGTCEGAAAGVAHFNSIIPTSAGLGDTTLLYSSQ